MNYIAAVNIIGALGFLVATYYAFDNYAFTKRLSGYWSLFAIASITATIWLLLSSIEELGIEFGAFDPFKDIPFIIAVTLFVGAAVIYPASKDLVSPKKK